MIAEFQMTILDPEKFYTNTTAFVIWRKCPARFLSKEEIRTCEGRRWFDIIHIHLLIIVSSWKSVKLPFNYIRGRCSCWRVDNNCSNKLVLNVIVMVPASCLFNGELTVPSEQWQPHYLRKCWRWCICLLQSSNMHRVKAAEQKKACSVF